MFSSITLLLSVFLHSQYVCSSAALASTSTCVDSLVFLRYSKIIIVKNSDIPLNFFCVKLTLQNSLLSGIPANGQLCQSGDRGERLCRQDQVDS